MRSTDFRGMHLPLTMAVVTIALLPACTINAKKDQNGEDKQVDISTPIGGIHVSKQVDPSDVGIAIYPGARLKPKDDGGDDKSANVNVSGFGFGLKVVALEYESDDAPSKVLAFYRGQLKKYGTILTCHTSHLELDTDMKDSDHQSEHQSSSNSNELKCEGTSGSNTELKVGTKDNQHIVEVEPAGKGSSFSLVYVRTHGKQADI